jgi:hypothetical protein
VFALVVACFPLSTVAQAGPVAEAANSPSRGHPADSKKSSKSTLTVLDWLAFGSGCNLSKDKKVGGGVQIEKSENGRYQIRYQLGNLKLILKDRTSGLIECALRISLEPESGTRIKHVSAKTGLMATKDSATHLRSRTLLMVGDAVAARHARRRHQGVYLSSDSSTENLLSGKECGKPQIIGLDFTFEGKKETQDKNSKEQQGAEISLDRPEENHPKADVQFEIESTPCRG